MSRPAPAGLALGANPGALPQAVYERRALGAKHVPSGFGALETPAFYRRFETFLASKATWHGWCCCNHH
jgi:hypothetical protein